MAALKSSWRLEAQRIRRQGGSPWNPKTYLSNDVLNAWLMTVVLWGALIAVFGPALIPFLIIQAVFGFSLLESVNYLEHYGLLRHKNDNGRYERCTPEHSWNSDHIVTNLFLYHLQRHSDHHANPTRRYQTLRSMDGVAEPAQRLRGADRGDLLPAAVAQADGPPGASSTTTATSPGSTCNRGCARRSWPATGPTV